jgi:hypothetical protein
MGVKQEMINWNEVFECALLVMVVCYVLRWCYEILADE